MKKVKEWIKDKMPKQFLPETKHEEKITRVVRLSDKTLIAKDDLVFLPKKLDLFSVTHFFEDSIHVLVQSTTSSAPVEYVEYVEINCLKPLVPRNLQEFEKVLTET